MAKHIFVTGGVVSSLGKGITAASLGQLLKARGYKVTMQKMDPYLNVDPGTMSPFQHGEVFVTEDGHEGDLDLGHYERFIDENLSRESNFTQGSIYQTLDRPRAPRRFPRRHRAGHPARDRGHQGADPPRGRAVRCRHRHLGDRGHHRRHRGPALHRGGAPVQEGDGAGQRAVRPRDARAVYRRGPRGEDQAHPALREGAAILRRAARLHRVPVRSRDHRRRAREDRAVLRRRYRRRAGLPRCAVHLRSTHQPLRAGIRHLSPGEDGTRAPQDKARSLARLPEGEGRLFGRSGHRRGGQVREPAGCLPLHQRGARGRRHRGGAPRERAPHRRRGAHRQER